MGDEWSAKLLEQQIQSIEDFIEIRIYHLNTVGLSQNLPS
jgi:hypothetical protein